MTKREFLDTVFALAPNEANAIMDAFDEYVDSNAPHWIPISKEPEEDEVYLATFRDSNGDFVDTCDYDSVMGWGFYPDDGDDFMPISNVIAYMPMPEPYKEVTT